jgi:hypothetical protein
MESYLEDNRPTLDEICEEYDECTEKCPSYECCHSKLESVKFDTEKIMTLLEKYIEKHPLAVECGGEYIMQDDEAQVDAINLVCNIFDNM